MEMEPRIRQRQAAARKIVQSRLNREQLPPLEEDIRPRDEDEAYLIQRMAHDQLGLGEIVGRKIGCTTSVMQAYLGISNPCAGGIFASMTKASGAHFDSRRHLRVGVECEIAVRLGRDLVPDAAGHVSMEQAAAAVSACMAAIEVVEDRYLDYISLGSPTLIADDFFNLGCVLGDEHDGFPAATLDSAEARMEINGVTVGEGKGTDVLGHPLIPLCWLAENAGRLGDPLKRGEFILLGSLVQTHWVQAGDTVRIVNSLLGEVCMHLR